MSDFPNDQRIIENDLPVCEYCGAYLSHDNIAFGDTTCDCCYDTNQAVRKEEVLNG